MLGDLTEYETNHNGGWAYRAINGKLELFIKSANIDTIGEALYEQGLDAEDIVILPSLNFKRKSEEAITEVRKKKASILVSNTLLKTAQCNE